MCGTSGLPYPTAELAWGLVLALFRRIPVEDRATREGGWQTTVGLGLNGKTLGVLGLGTLGSRVARYRARLRDGGRWPGARTSPPPGRRRWAPPW